MKRILIIISAILVVLTIAIIVFINVSFISKKEVKEIVLENANLMEEDVRRWSIELGYEDGIWEYDVEYVYNNQEYNYEIDAKTGDIILHKIDR